jgi:hypothetical protein
MPAGHEAFADAFAMFAIRVQRRVSSRGSIAVAHQRITVGMAHAGAIVDVEDADTTIRVYLDDQLLTEVARTTTKPIARFKAHKPEPPRQHQTAHRPEPADNGPSLAESPHAR